MEPNIQPGQAPSRIKRRKPDVGFDHKKRREAPKKTFSPQELSVITRIANRQIAKKAETKYRGFNINDAPTTSGIFTLINSIANGTGDSDRVGDSIYMKSVIFNFYTSIGDSLNTVRAIIFQWLDDSVPTLPDVLQSGIATDAIVSLYNHDNLFGKKMNILYDKNYTMVSGANNERQVDSGMLTKLAPRKVHYPGSGSAIPDNNRLYLLTLSDSAAVPNPGLNGFIRVRYNDM